MRRKAFSRLHHEIKIEYLNIDTADIFSVSFMLFVNRITFLQMKKSLHCVFVKNILFLFRLRVIIFFKEKSTKCHLIVYMKSFSSRIQNVEYFSCP